MNTPNHAHGHGRDTIELVHLTRGDIVESRHFGTVVVAHASGEVLAAWGNAEMPVYPRSAIKSLQALALVETGAAEGFGLVDEEVSIACASHFGEPEHLATVDGMLAKAGLDGTALACGACPPHSDATKADLARADRQPDRRHNVCSGKHAGMLLAASHIGAPVEGYHKVTHPVQQRILGVLEQMCGMDLGHVARAPDGCSVPTWALPIGNLALAMARFGQPDDQPDLRQAACQRIREAQWAAPFMVAGTGAFVSGMLAAGRGAVILKNGAEGVYTAALPRSGLGIAIKVGDGADRAAEVAMAALLDRFGELDGAAAALARDTLVQTRRNHAGEPVGTMCPAPGWINN